MDVGIYIGLGGFLQTWRNAIYRAWLYVSGKTSPIDSKGSFSNFRRNSVATLVDFEGLVKTTIVDEARIEQLRRVENLTSQAEDFSQPEWVKTDGTATKDILTSTDANATFLQVYTAVAGDYVFSVDLKRKTGAGDIQFAADSGSYTTVALTAEWNRFSVQQVVAAGSKNYGLKIVTGGDEIYVRKALLEFVEGQANQNPSEYTKPQWQNKYLSFDGNDDFAVIPDSNDLDFTTEFSIVAQIKLIDTYGFNAILSKAAYHLTVSPDKRLVFSARSAVDGTSWAEVEDFTDTIVYSLVVFNEYLYAGTGFAGKIYRSSDGDTWAEVEDFVDIGTLSLAVFNGYIYAGTGSSGKIYRSSDGDTWAEAEDTTESYIESLVVFDGFLYGGSNNNGKVYRTSDGTTWAEIEDTTENAIHCLAVFNGYLYAGTGASGKIYRSLDGDAWIEVEDTAETDIHTLVEFNGYLYAGTGTIGKIYRSLNGTTWEEVEDTAESDIFSLAVFNGYLYAGTSGNGKIYRSLDGTTWAEVEDLTETGIFSLAVFKGALYAGTGTGSKIYRMDGGFDLYSNTVLSLDTSFHIGATYDKSLGSANAKIYIDGALDASLDSVIDIDTNALDLFVGKSHEGQIFKGILSNIKLFNKELTIGEIQTLFNSGKVVSGLAGAWAMNDLEGEIVNDSSGNNNNGTLRNFIFYPKYYNYENANTVVSNQVVEARGAIIITQGILLEKQRTNLLTYSEQFDNVAWTDSDITVADDSVVAPDGFSTAETLTATAGNGTILQTITSGSANRVFSIWLKRKTGTGNIDLTVDGGTGWTTKALTTEWDRYDITQVAVTNPSSGIRIVTDTDAIYAWSAQLESADFSSSSIKTEAAAITREADSLEYELAGGAFPQSFQLSLEVIPLADGDKYATTDFRLFGTDDATGTVDEVSTVGHIDTYDYTHATGGGVFQLSQADFVAGTSTTLSFKLRQEGSNVRAIIIKDKVEKLNTTVVGTLAHSDANKLIIGRWDSDYFSGHFKNIKLWSA